MTPAADAFGVGSQQDVDNMLGTEALACARDAREDLLGGDGRISEVFQLVETEVAGCAVFHLVDTQTARRAFWFGVLLPEVFGQFAVPATNPGAESAHVLE